MDDEREGYEGPEDWADEYLAQQPYMYDTSRPIIEPAAPEPKPLISVLGNGNGAFFFRCHCCHATSPTHDTPDDLHVLAKAQAAGWAVTQVGDEYRLFCYRPTCQTQAG